MGHTPDRLRILIVDDDPSTLDAFSELLLPHFSVVAASDPFEARRLLLDPDLAVVVSDHWMPGMNGDELLRIANRESLASRILVTARPEVAALEEAVNRGQIFGFMIKPVDPSSFVSLVRRAGANFLLRWELRRERALVRSLLDHAPDYVFFKDEGRRFWR